MKHAYLIIAHQEVEILKVLLTLLDDKRNDVFLHIDKKSEALFEAMKSIKLERAGFYLLQKRIDVRWGDISQIKVELLLLKTALNQGHYSYLHLLSGVDLPIKSQDYIHDFFTRHAGFEFVGFAHKKTDDENAREKAGYIYLFTRYIKDDNKLRRFITKCIKYGYIRCQKLFIINDIVPCGLKKVQIGFPLQNALPVLFCLKKNTFYQCLNIHYVLTKFLFKPCYGIHLFNFLFIIKMMNLKAVYG